MDLSTLVKVVVALVVLVIAVKIVLLALPLLLLVVAVAVVGGGLYLRGASHGDRQRLVRSARRLLRG